MDVDSSRIHRISLVTNEYGDVRNVYCVPCGPLTPEEDVVESETTMSEIDEGENIIEDNYTKVDLNKN